MSLKELLKEKREEILSIAAKNGAFNVRIFGSVAREETADSDVDLLVELEPDRNLLDRIALMQDLEDLLGRKVDVATVKGLRKYFRDRILNEAVPAVTDDRIYVAEIAERIERILLYTTEGREDFFESLLIQDAVIRNFEVIGEATKKLSLELRQQYPDIPWRRIAGFRDVLIHDYMGIDLDEVWDVVDRDLPELKSNVEAILQELAAKG